MERKAFPFVLLVVLVLSTVVVSFVEAQSITGQELLKEVQKAMQTINDNQILKAWQNESTQIGIGTVQSLACKEDLFDGYQTIFTYAEILIDMPLTDNLRSKQTIFVKYVGGQIGDRWLDVCIDWVSYSNDTVTPPERFKLNKGLSLMFFANATTNTLIGYLPYKLDSFVGDSAPVALLLSEPQPTTWVYESYGYGFEWTGCVVDWDDLPWVFQIDIDGTDDIDGEDTEREILAVQTGICTWEGAQCSGFTVSDGGTWNYTTLGEYSATPNDDHNMVGWVDGLDWYVLGMCYRHGDASHLTRADIALHDDTGFTWTIGSSWSNYDVQSAVTHEFGHVVGLQNVNTSSTVGQTMHIPATNDISQQTLEWGDLNGAHYLYPEHNDAGCGGDAGDSINDPTYIDRNTVYVGRLCDLPDDQDGSDYFSFYAPSTMRLFLSVDLPPNADFDLELYDPNQNLIAYSRTAEVGGTEGVLRQPIGNPSGLWIVRIYNRTNIPEYSNGEYELAVYDFGAKYISDSWGEILGGNGGYWDPASARGGSPDGNEAGVYGYDPGDSAAIMGTMNGQVSGTHDVYIYGHAFDNLAYIHVYVSNDYDTWTNIFTGYIYDTSPYLIYIATTTFDWHYIGVSIYNDDYVTNAFMFDCVIVT